jgi:hypothetical protein
LWKRSSNQPKSRKGEKNNGSEKESGEEESSEEGWQEESGQEEKIISQQTSIVKPGNDRSFPGFILAAPAR